MQNAVFRYHIKSDVDSKNVLIFDLETGEFRHPSCGRILAAYYEYLVECGRIDESQKVLAEAMSTPPTV